MTAKKKSTKRAISKPLARKKRTRVRASQNKSGKKQTRRWRTGLFKLGLVFTVIVAGFLIYLDATVKEKFEGRRWAVPAKVYARPLEIYSGLSTSPQALVDELVTLGYRFNKNYSQPGVYIKNGNQFIIHTRGFQFWDGYEQAQIIKLSINNNIITNVVNDKNQVLNLVRLEPLVVGGIYPAHNEDRELVRLDQVPQQLIDTLIAVEDRKYYQHFGVSIRGLARAMWANIRAGAWVQGGSTITQQLIKNFYLTSERTLSRKLMELPMAVLLELHYDKDDILETYLNEVYLGQVGKRAIHGVGLASRHYFGQPLNELELHQVALLVGLFKGPSKYDPRRHPEQALKRRNIVLDVLVDQNLISDEKAVVEKAKPLGVTSRAAITALRFPAYMDLVRRQLQRDYQAEDLSSEGLRIFTNFDPWVQKQAEQSVENTLQQLASRYGQRAEGLESAVVVTNTNTGEVLAIVGGKDVRYSGFNRALDAVRPIGSLVKPAVYLAALQQSDIYTLISLLDDSPLVIKQPGGKVWEPKNYDKTNHGFVPLHRSLAKSYNIATVRLGMDVGINNVVNTLQRLGIRRELNAFPSLMLGTAELSPLEVTVMYQTIAAGGFRSPLRAIRHVLTAESEPIARYPLAVEQMFDAGAIHLLQYALQETMREGTGRSVYNILADHLNVAGKTGTTNDLRDSWFAGFTGDRLAVAWVGKDDNSKTPLTGSSGALQVWAKLMRSIQTKEAFIASLPDNIEYSWVDEQVGTLTESTCPNARYVPFLYGSTPKQYQSCVKQRPQKHHWFKSWFE